MDSILYIFVLSVGVRTQMFSLLSICVLLHQHDTYPTLDTLEEFSKFFGVISSHIDSSVRFFCPL